MSVHFKNTVLSKDFLTTEQVAQHMTKKGYPSNSRTIRLLCQNKKIPHTRYEGVGTKSGYQYIISKNMIPLVEEIAKKPSASTKTYPAIVRFYGKEFDKTYTNDSTVKTRTPIPAFHVETATKQDIPAPVLIDKEHHLDDVADVIKNVMKMKPIQIQTLKDFLKTLD